MKDWLSNKNLKRTALFGAGVGYFVIALLSLMPAAYRPDIGSVSDKFEHALAYLLLGALSALAMRRTAPALALAIVAYGGALELSQLLIPSRVPSFGDFVAGALGAIVGVSIVVLLVRRLATQ
jgi:VanZ family protein